MKLTFDDLAAGSDIHIVVSMSGAILIQPRPDCEEEFDTLVTHLYEVGDRKFAILPKMGPHGFYTSAEVMRLN
ncbi:hypothetical protein [Brevundimonas sp. Marseille-Q4549]